MSRKEFIMSLVYSLLNIPREEQYVCKKVKVRVNVSKKMKKQNDDCRLLFDKGKKRDCTVCSSQSQGKIRKRTSTYCSTCDSAVCATPCYDEHRILKG